MKIKLILLFAVLTAAVLNAQAADVDLSNSTIYLSANGKAYENDSQGQEITSQVANMGLEYNATYSKWYMTDFTFTTTANKGLDFGDMSYNLFIVVQGKNKIEVNCTDTNASVIGINTYALDKIMGSSIEDSLTVNTSNSTGLTNAPFSVDMSGATVYNMTLITKAGYGRNYSKGFKVNNALVVDHASVTFEGGETSSETYWSVGYQGGDSLVLKNQSTFRAFTNATKGLKFGAVISGLKAAGDTMYAAGTADALTLSKYGSSSHYTFYNGSEIATDVTNVKTETYTLTGASATAGGGVTFTVGGTEVTEAAEGKTVTVAGVAVEGYYVTGFTSDQVAISTDSTFTMPADSVTVTAIYAQYDDRIIVTNTYTAESPYKLTDGKTYTMEPYAGNGGAVEVQTGGNLTGTNITFADNEASGTDTKGGAIYNAGILTLEGATFAGNSATSGGAIYNMGTVNFTDSVTLCTASDGIEWDLSTANAATISGYQYLKNNGNAKLMLNLKNDQAPGDYVIATGDFDRAELKKNNSINFIVTINGGDELGIQDSVQFYTINYDSPYAANAVASGGYKFKISIVASDDPGEDKLVFTVTSGIERTIVNNTKYSPDGICTLTTGETYTENMFYVEESGTLTGKNVTFANSSSFDYGGAIYNTGTIKLESATFSADSVLKMGGAIYNKQGTITLNGNTTFSGNKATTGGAIYNNGGTVNMANTVTLATENDDIYNKGTLNWNLTGEATGKLVGYQYLTNDASGKLILTVKADQAKGDYVIATGDFDLAKLEANNSTKFYIVTGTDSTAITVDGGMVAHAKVAYKLALKESTEAGADQLVLSAVHATKIGDKTYGTLVDALDNVKDDETITLCETFSEAAAIISTVDNFTIDLNGNSYTNTNSLSVVEGLNVVDSKVGSKAEFKLAKIGTNENSATVNLNGLNAKFGADLNEKLAVNVSDTTSISKIDGTQVTLKGNTTLKDGTTLTTGTNVTLSSMTQDGSAALEGAKLKLNTGNNAFEIEKGAALTLSDGADVTCNGSSNGDRYSVSVSGTLTMTGTNTKLTAKHYFANYGTMTISSGAELVSNTQYYGMIHNKPTGVMTVDGATLTALEKIANYGTMTLKGDNTLTGTNNGVENSFIGTMTVESGTTSVTGTVVNSGTINLKGGTLTATGLTNNGTINLKGGSLMAAGLTNNGTVNWDITDSIASKIDWRILSSTQTLGIIPGLAQPFDTTYVLADSASTAAGKTFYFTGFKDKVGSLTVNGLDSIIYAGRKLHLSVNGGDSLILSVKPVNTEITVSDALIGHWFKQGDAITLGGRAIDLAITDTLTVMVGDGLAEYNKADSTWTYTFASHADTDSTQYIIKVTDGSGNSDSVYYTLRVDTEVPGLGDITVASGASLEDSIHGYSGQWITKSHISVILPANDSTSGVQDIDSVYYDGQKLGSEYSFSNDTLVINPRDYSDIKGGELKVYLTDKAGNSTDTAIVLNIDTKAPVVETGEFIGESKYVNGNGTIWYRQGDATAAYKTVITDATSGLKSATFLDSLYNAQDSLFAIPVAKEDSIRGLKYITAIDTAGNQVSVEIDTLICIDGTVPMITIGKTITATDDLSGFAKMYYKFAGIADEFLYDSNVGAFDIKKAGKFEFHAVDKVGNDTVLDMTASEDLTNVMYDGTIIYAKPDANGSVRIQDGAKVLMSWLLKDSLSLDSIFIGAELDSIGAQAFEGCTNLKYMKVEAEKTAALDSLVWGGLAKHTVRMDVPAGSILDYMNAPQWEDRLYYIFYNGIWYDITDKEEQTPKYVKIISSQDTTIYKDAIEIPESFEYGDLKLTPIEVGDTAFAGCAVTDIILPSGVTKIDSAAFAGCTELDNLELRAMKVAEFHETAFDEDSEIMYYVPAEFNELYKSDLNWKPVNDRISHLVTVTEAGYATLYTYDRVIAESDSVETFIPTTAGSAGNLFIDLGTAIQKGTVLPGQNGMIIKAPQGIYRYKVSTSAAGTDKQSSLDGVILDRPFSYSDYNGKVFTLSTESGETTFYRFKGKTLRAGHAFLNIQTGQQSIPFGQGTTGIKAVNALENADIYNLSGLKVEHITEPGLYIVNGVKTYVK